jgi:hypothetical protein
MKANSQEIQSFKSNPPALVVLDLGNSDLKGMLAGKSETETLLRHEIAFAAPAHFERMSKRAEMKNIEYEGAEFFRKLYKDKSETLVMIGDGVTQNARSNKLTGEAKYQEKYFDALLASMLKRLLPKGHDNIWVALATPADAIDYIDVIKAITGGLHKIMALDGREIKYRVTRLVMWEEPQGGMIRFMKRNAAEKSARVNIEADQRIIVVDIGGKISSMTVIGIGRRMEATPLYNESPDPFNLGIIDVLDTFGKELKGLHPKEFQLFKTAASIPSNILQSGIRKGKVQLSGETLDVNQARLNSLAKIADELERLYQNELNGGANAAHIVVTGGGGGLLLPALRDEILNHKSIHPADEVGSINFANLRGGSEAFLEWLGEMGFIEHA